MSSSPLGVRKVLEDGTYISSESKKLGGIIIDLILDSPYYSVQAEFMQYDLILFQNKANEACPPICF